MVRSFFSASSVLGSRAGSVGVGVAGCPGAAWVWVPSYRPLGSVRSGVSLALAVPQGVAFAPLAAALARSFPALRVSVRFWRGRVFLRVRGSGLFAVAVWWSGVR